MNKKIALKTFEAFREGDNNVFKEIMIDNYPKIFGFINKMVKSEWDAEELTQDVFIKLWENHDKVKSPESFYSFLFTIAKNSVLNFISKNAPKIVEYDDSVVTELAPDVGSLMEARELDLLITLLVEQMPPQRKRIFIMSRQEGLSIDEIANKLNISKNTVFSHLSSALDYLRNNLILITSLFLWIKSI